MFVETFRKLLSAFTALFDYKNLNLFHLTPILFIICHLTSGADFNVCVLEALFHSPPPPPAYSKWSALRNVLGPLLFLIYIVVLPDEAVSCLCLLFADDAKLSGNCKDSLQQDVDSFCLWSIRNNKVFHASKTKLLSFRNDFTHLLLL